MGQQLPFWGQIPPACNLECPSSSPTSLSSEVGFLNSVCRSVENEFEIISFPNHILGSQI